jgi:hypothetical protein
MMRRVFTTVLLLLAYGNNQARDKWQHMNNIIIDYIIELIF